MHEAGSKAVFLRTGNDNENNTKKDTYIKIVLVNIRYELTVIKNNRIQYKANTRKVTMTLFTKIMEVIFYFIMLFKILRDLYPFLSHFSGGLHSPDVA